VRFEVNESCVGCLACVRECPAQAVAVDGFSVRIVDEACIRVGACVPACPHDAVAIVGDLGRALTLARSHRAVLVLGSEASVYFYPSTPEQVVNACYGAGFRAVHRSVIGDELVAQAYGALLAAAGWRTMIRSTCPVVVEWVRRRYPELVPYLAPVATPVAVEVAYHRKVYGEDVPIVYAGIGAVAPDVPLDAVITLEELAELFRALGINPGEQLQFHERIPEVSQRHLSAPGGLPYRILQEVRMTSRGFLKLRGLDGLEAVARAVMDVVAAEGLDHPMLGPREEAYWRRRVAREAAPPRSPFPVVDPAIRVDVRRTFELPSNGQRPSDAEIEGVIERIGTLPDGAHWDCGACGYATCVAFAEAFLRGRATLRQCPPYQERRAEEALREVAVDELTGLASYRVLRARLQQEVARSARSGEPFGVVFADVDRFKELNDRYGHEEGNRVLAAIGADLLRVVRKTDVAARYGGDEFVIVLFRTDADGAHRVGGVVRESLERAGRELGHGPGVVTVSIGTASHDPRYPEQGDVLEAADRALYRAKAAGGNRVESAERYELAGNSF
jgi:diguanylate cyclase (GGDEF)-like protein